MSIATGNEPSDEHDRLQRAGQHLFDVARRMGWTDDGEGAFEFVQRLSYEHGKIDGSTIEAQGAVQASQREWIDTLADYVADNWPDRKYALDEIEKRLRDVVLPLLCKGAAS